MAFVESGLKRRRGARRRCGAAYRVIEAQTAEGLSEVEITQLIEPRSPFLAKHARD